MELTLQQLEATLWGAASTLAWGRVAPVIERRCTLSEVPDAMHYAEQGHARGKLVVTMGEPEAS